MSNRTALGIPSGSKEPRPAESDQKDGTRWDLELDNGTIAHQVVHGGTWTKTD